jgi:hypothetical protein
MDQIEKLTPEDREFFAMLPEHLGGIKMRKVLRIIQQQAVKLAAQDDLRLEVQQLQSALGAVGAAAINLEGQIVQLREENRRLESVCKFELDRRIQRFLAKHSFDDVDPDIADVADGVRPPLTDPEPCSCDEAVGLRGLLVDCRIVLDRWRFHDRKKCQSELCWDTDELVARLPTPTKEPQL